MIEVVSLRSEEIFKYQNWYQGLSLTTLTITVRPFKLLKQSVDATVAALSTESTVYPAD